jgi:hypothetical protein
MATGRVDGQPNQSLDRLLPRVSPRTPAAVTEGEPSETAAVADPELASDLDIVKKSRRFLVRRGVTDADPVSDLDLDALVEMAGERADARPASAPNQCIAEFAEPRISDPAILQGGRPLSILERIAADLVPTLGENEELRSLAGKVIADEIDRHRRLAAQLLTGIPS